MAAITSKFNFEYLIQYHTDQWSCPQIPSQNTIVDEFGTSVPLNIENTNFVSPINNGNSFLFSENRRQIGKELSHITHLA